MFVCRSIEPYGRSIWIYWVSVWSKRNRSEEMLHTFFIFWLLPTVILSILLLFLIIVFCLVEFVLHLLHHLSQLLIFRQSFTSPRVECWCSDRSFLSLSWLRCYSINNFCGDLIFDRLIVRVFILISHLEALEIVPSHTSCHSLRIEIDCRFDWDSRFCSGMLILAEAHMALDSRDTSSREHSCTLSRLLALVSCYNHDVLFIKLFLISKFN